MLDSLVRVSRRVDENHFVKIVITHSIIILNTSTLKLYNIVILTSIHQQKNDNEASRRVISSSIQSKLK
jgi:hypothetical protein